jgi:hypothetical protein
MKELEKWLKNLQSKWYEQVNISDVLLQIHFIRMEGIIKRNLLDK